MRTLRATLVLLFLAVSGAAGGYIWFDSALHAAGPGGKARLIEIPQGASKTRVAKILVDQGLVQHPWALELWLRIHADLPSPKAGRHLIDPQMPFPRVFQTLANTPITEDLSITLVEGWRLSEADEFLAQKELIEPGEYLEAASNASAYTIGFPTEGSTLAGYLLPDTYRVRPGKLKVGSLIQRQLDAFAQRFYIPHQAEIQKSGRRLRVLVIMASLLEREEPKPEVRPLVAGVLYNRLDAHNPLGVDATSRYTLANWNDRKSFLRKLRDPTDPWNTRLKAGLPPGPIGAPSLSSLVSALHPKRTKNWYYLHDKQQRIHFSRTAAEHEAKRKKYNVW
ncbi:MAG: endolytic transglycosylase MltG [Myxococcales bacterium]|nr:endolytic transglycosylase MltG [Myxococcales bacterium]